MAGDALPGSVPLLASMPPTEGLLPYWLGLGRADGAWVAVAQMAARLFIALLVITLMATWYGDVPPGAQPGAQPVAFAFRGEATPLWTMRVRWPMPGWRLIACLGLGGSCRMNQLSGAAGLHRAGVFAVAMPTHRGAAVALVLGMAGLTLSRAPLNAVGPGLRSGLVLLGACSNGDRRWRWAAHVGSHRAAAGLAQGLDLWRWRVV